MPRIWQNDDIVRTEDIQAWEDSRIPPGLLAPFAGATAPDGWLLCDGAAVSRTDHADLFTALGETYGAGDGSTTFNLPDLRRRVPVGAGGSRSQGPQTALGATGGREAAAFASHTHGGGSHTHTAGAHRHGLAAAVGSGGGSHTAVQLLAGSNAVARNQQTNRINPQQYMDDDVTSAAGGATGPGSATTGAASSGASDGNFQPSLVLHYIIKT